MLNLLIFLHSLVILRRLTCKMSFWAYMSVKDLMRAITWVSRLHIATLSMQAFVILLSNNSVPLDYLLYAFLNLSMLAFTRTIATHESLEMVRQSVVNEKVYTEYRTDENYNFIIMHNDAVPTSITEDRHIFNMVTIDDKDVTRDVNKFFMYTYKLTWGDVFDYIGQDYTKESRLVRLYYNNEDLDFACFSTSALCEKNFTGVLYEGTDSSTASAPTESGGESQDDSE